MKQLPLDISTYSTKERELSFAGRYFPSLYFYSRTFATVFRAALLARQGEYDAVKWHDSSLEILCLLEDIGVMVDVSGLEYIRRPETEPSVIIGNHMSFLETLLLPGLILPHPVTFVVKQSLMDYPVFKHVMRSSDPIAVSRTNPRQDLKTVLQQGCQRLEAGYSVVIFPQSTRSHMFDPVMMSSIGVKLAKKANVPVIPLALKTDALKNGVIVKDFGGLDRNIPVRIAFDSPLRVSAKGVEEMEVINQFIERKITEWSREL